MDNLMASIRKLRAETGVGVLDAKDALLQNDGDMDAAKQALRLKGKAKAAGKADRVAGDGLIGMHIENGTGVLVEVNSETDFAARNSEFASFVVELSKIAASVDDIPALLAAPMNDTTVEGELTGKIAQLRENIVIRRMQKVTGSSVTGYIHNQVVAGAGKIGTLVGSEGLDDETGRKIAMHVAAARPISLSEDDFPAKRAQQEKDVLRKMAENSGKPDHIIDKIVTSGLRTLYTNETLVNQKFVIDPSVTVSSVVEKEGGKITGYAYLKVGEDADG